MSMSMSMNMGMSFQMINRRILSFVVLFSMAYVAFFYGSIDSSTRLYQQKEVDKAVILSGLVANQVSGYADSNDLQANSQAFKSSIDSILDIKILKLAGAKVIASTLSQDQNKNLPFRLPKDQKSFFDQAKKLKAAHKKTLEGRFINPLVSHTWLESDSRNTIEVVYPYVVNGRFKGVVKVNILADAPPEQAHNVAGWLMLMAVAWLLLALYEKRQPHNYQGRLLKISESSHRSIFYGGVFILLSIIACYQVMQTFSIEQLQMVDSIKGLLTSLASEYSLQGSTLWIDRYGQDMQRLGLSTSPYYQQWMASNNQGLLYKLMAAFLLGLLLLVFVVSGRAAKTRQTIQENRQAYMYVMPAMLGMLLLVFFPFGYGVLLSFTDTTMFNESLPFSERFVGLENYFSILGDFNLFKELDGQRIVNYDNFYWTLFITICWTVSNVVLAVGLGLLLALALNDSRLKFRWFFRVVLILPWAIPNYITALVWKGMFHQQFGVINQVIQLFGFEPIDWFGSVFTSFLTGLTTNVWLGFPFMMVVILGGLQSISTDMYEAAKIDGANRWQQFKYVTWPSLKPTLLPAVILSVVWTFNMFNVIYLVSSGEPAGANEILITQAYKIGFEKMQYAYAAAYSVVIFMILLVYGVFQNKVSKATEGNS